MRLLRYIAKICRRNGEGPQRLQCPRCRDWSVILLILETGKAVCRKCHGKIRRDV